MEQLKLDPGWLWNQIKTTREEVAKWPEWFRIRKAPMTDAEIIAGLREKSKGMFGDMYLLLTRAADRLEQLTTPQIEAVGVQAGTSTITATVRELSRTEHEPLDRWEER